MKISTSWKSSKSPTKQRNYVKRAPLHIRHTFMSVHLSPELRKTYNRRAVPVRVGDRIKVLRGQYKGKENKVDRVDAKQQRVYVVGIERGKKDGSKALIPVKASNLMIMELNLDDKKRKKAIEKQSKTAEKTVAKQASKPADKPAEPAENKAKPAEPKPAGEQKAQDVQKAE